MLSASHLVRRFGDRLAVDGVTFEVKAGEVFGLLGPNGAGKTTILRMLGGLIQATSGEVRIGGVRMVPGTASAFRTRIGFLTETPGSTDRRRQRHRLCPPLRGRKIAGVSSSPFRRCS